ncbi:MAG: hypothetical protein JNM59_04300 [Hyphomonadaceae bacterium]|nr:hypothetical protein [Hyphomonadaceae bacterium]
MTFILRWPAVLVLLALVLVSLGAALSAGLVLSGAPIDLSVALTEEQIAQIRGVNWIEVGLWSGAGVFFLIAAVRLIRRTQGFWVWLLGFACYGGRWGYAQSRGEGDLVATVQGVDVDVYREPAALANAPDSTEAQLALLAVILIVGLVIAIVDHFDREYWNTQGV